MQPPGTQPHLDPGYYERLVHSSGFAIVSCRPDGTIAAWNPAAERLFAHDPRLDGGRPLADLFEPADRTTVARHLRECQASGRAQEFQVTLGCEAGQPVHYAVLLTPVPADDGSLEGVAAWFRDVSTRVRLQRQLDKQTRLNLLGELAGAVAHHYNNLLCSIATSVEYAMNMNTMAAMRRASRRTSEAVARASRITRQLLAFAQADFSSCDQADLTETFLLFFDEWEPRLAAHGIALELNVEKLPPAPVLREPLRVALTNIVENAIEVMPGGGTLTASLARHDEQRARISIADTGGGISPTDMEHLFEPFHTSKRSRGGASGGAGLGLAVAHGLISEMHGAISASNVPSVGARFDILLLLEPRPAGEPSEPDQSQDR